MFSNKTTFMEDTIDTIFPKAQAQFFSGENKIFTFIVAVALGFVLAANTLTLLVIAGAGLLIGGGCWIYEKINQLFDKNHRQCEEDYGYVQSSPDLWKSTKTFSELKNVISIASKDSLSPDDVAHLGSKVEFECEDFMQKHLGFTCKSQESYRKTCNAAQNYKDCVKRISVFLKGKEINQQKRGSSLKQISEPSHDGSMQSGEGTNR